MKQSRSMDPPGRHGGGEDEANYALAWFPHFLATGSPAVVEHFEHLRDQLAGWVQRECLHGYEPEAEAHHGTEPFLLFLPRYLGLFPEDRVAAALLADAAEHIGNWVEGIPAWFDWVRNRFYGYHIGTRAVGRDPEHAVELAEHFRFIHIALAAYRVLKQDRYLDWALRYGRRRAEMIVAAPKGDLPVMWGPDGHPLRECGYTESQRRMSAASHRLQGDPAAGVEVLLASGAVQALGDLFLLSGEQVFRDAAFRIVEGLVVILHDPYCDPGAAAVSYYRGAFGDDTLDGRIREMVARIPDGEAGELVLMVPEIPRMVFSRRRKTGGYGALGCAGRRHRPDRANARALHGHVDVGLSDHRGCFFCIAGAEAGIEEVKGGATRVEGRTGACGHGWGSLLRRGRPRKKLGFRSSDRMLRTFGTGRPRAPGRGDARGGISPVGR